MRRSELLALRDAVTVSLGTAAQAFDIHPETAASLVANGEFPVPVIKVGRKTRVSTAALFKVLDIDPRSL